MTVSIQGQNAVDKTHSIPIQILKKPSCRITLAIMPLKIIFVHYFDNTIVDFRHRANHAWRVRCFVTMGSRPDLDKKKTDGRNDICTSDQ